MSLKRPRPTYETESQTCVAFGTPLPSIGGDDVGRFIPLWKQEAKDERGRKRLHGAFTGGWSAGYHNTVGSRDGWTPSSFVSSRTDRSSSSAHIHGPEHYMDDEDLADAAEAHLLHTSTSFSGLGPVACGEETQDSLSTLFRQADETLGFGLLQKMGWRYGQGIGHKIHRETRLDDFSESGRTTAGKTHVFAPDDVAVARFCPFDGRRGLCFGREGDLPRESPDESGDKRAFRSRDMAPGGRGVKDRGGIGVGILNDTGSDEDDYNAHIEYGPKIKFIRRRNGLPATKEKVASSDTRAFLPAPHHQGTPQMIIRGFTVSQGLKQTSSVPDKLYPLPKVPPGWAIKRGSAVNSEGVLSGKSRCQVAAKHDPKSRATLLGEQALPEKSVFSFLSSSARERLAAATGRHDLPPARDERLITRHLPESTKTNGSPWSSPWSSPKLDKHTATSALTRSTRKDGPYLNDQPKRQRYEAYLKFHAGLANALPVTLIGDNHDARREAREFHNCASIFKPMTGPMASRFTRATLTPGQTATPAHEDISQSQSLPLANPTDPSEAAARLGMYGHLTRSVETFHPAILLCKRFNVGPPLSTAKTNKETQKDTHLPVVESSFVQGTDDEAGHTSVSTQVEASQQAEVDQTLTLTNEIEREEMLRQIFGDSDSEN